MNRRVRSLRLFTIALLIPVVALVESRCNHVRPATQPSEQRLQLETWAKAPRIGVGVLVEVERVVLHAPSGVMVWPSRVDALTSAGAPRVWPQATFVTHEMRKLFQRPTVAAEAHESGSVETASLFMIEGGLELKRAFIVPADPSQQLSANEVPYRGVFEVRHGVKGIIVVNHVHLEDYLKGVVPNEMSPAMFPEIEALKAQAVAARTYAMHNLGQYRDHGYDVCASATCQVYRGQSSEQPLTDRAVEETRGLIVANQGKPINALFTSTCGGHTENVENIFPGRSSPQLQGVPCAPERGSWISIRGANPSVALSGEDAYAKALLESLDVLSTEDAKSWTKDVTIGVIDGWTTRLLRALERDGCEDEKTLVSLHVAAILDHVARRLCWREPARRFLSEQDVEYLLQASEYEALTLEDERRAAAYLIQEGILDPHAYRRQRPRSTLSRGELAGILARILCTAGAPAVRKAKLEAMTPDGLVIAQGEDESSARQTYALDSEARLFRIVDGLHMAVRSLSVIPGEEARLVMRNGKIVFLAVDQSRLGAAADRSSRYYRWEVRLTPQQIARSIARYEDVGEVRDIQPRRYGVSGRVIELTVIGSHGEYVLKGLTIRWALGLRENLFVVDRERDENGRVSRFVISGRGWGHGVGLCQVGAYGLARAGLDFRAILAHYYRGGDLISIAQGLSVGAER